MIINMNGAKAPETPSSVLQEKTVTPETLPTVIGPDAGYDGLTQVTVNPDAQLKAENIRSGKTIFGVTGSFVGEVQYSGDISIVLDKIQPTGESRPYVYTFGDKITEGISADDVNNFYGYHTYGYAYSYAIDGNYVTMTNKFVNGNPKHTKAYKAFVPARTVTYTTVLPGSADYTKIEAHIEYYFNAGLSTTNASYTAQNYGNELYNPEIQNEVVLVLEGDLGTDKRFTLSNTVPDGYLGLTTTASTLSAAYPYYVYAIKKMWFKPLE